MELAANMLLAYHAPLEAPMQKELTCPACGHSVIQYLNPAPTTDVVIYDPERGVVVIERVNEPHGFALPGGFVGPSHGQPDQSRRSSKMKHIAYSWRNGKPLRHWGQKGQA